MANKTSKNTSYKNSVIVSASARIKFLEMLNFDSVLLSNRSFCYDRNVLYPHHHLHVRSEHRECA